MKQHIIWVKHCLNIAGFWTVTQHRNRMLSLILKLFKFAAGRKEISIRMLLQITKKKKHKWMLLGTLFKIDSRVMKVSRVLLHTETQQQCSSPQPTFTHFLSALFFSIFFVLGSKATSWHREFKHANEGWSLTSWLSAYGEQSSVLVGSACQSLN